ncbi:dTDP-glucose 4,6-dehydratase [Lawsonia intracellularis]|uniref:dTDP-glucose 4,6-dehydratase n=1 Tax=Lawsonia intracellularis (strain PHE/MN1-00) TaxID=363253 RepID=Q1MPF7_LAWIP|nr:dTDP-glucose 4,6-dehydratase [Lawsonia intracellularis]AGC50501.1 dTDP-glucose 4,6-dehydratase [Lawsonia intracellularis N343]KAA0204520.1 dTDP-glucose 4,6-dehydratase [Lawsonia intracellularis]MBZ3892950.1 dTDP-glucose 4,6-dehydratase [Lawsonia intracellularis]RBN32895.1 dTDP-glucose 4,6-dehydratase [Lawsonia intracellularis]RBN35283.1 dTDP-glucose 4,6-dehydratase [Lawsonia intracellularis]
MQLLITGGCGFIGTNFIQLALKELKDVYIVNLDNLTYAGNPYNLKEIETTKPDQYLFIHGDIGNATLVQSLLQSYSFDAIINFAAESHVDRSITNALPFITTNILGTQILLDAARAMNVPKFIQISTDEVYGSLGINGKFSEKTPLSPNSPYSASKASADMLVHAAYKTYGINTIITRCSNNYGPYQFPEKLIPLMIHRALMDESLPIYGDGLQVRDWIHVEDHCRGILLVLEKGRPGNIYNFGGSAEQTNLAVVKEILHLLNKPNSLIHHVKDRPGHDRRYAMDFSKAAKELGYMPQITFNKGLAATVNWYLSHRDWVQNILSGDYKEFMNRWYKDRL